MPVAPVETIVQQMELPNLVELFKLTYQNSIFYFTNSFTETGIYWNSHLYTSFPLVLTGASYTAQNANEIPKLQLSNVGGRFTILLGTLPNLKGAKLEYVQTFETYVSETAGQDSSLFLFKRLLTLDKLLSRNAEQLVYECGTLTGFKQLLYPRRQMLRDGLPKMRFEGLGINKSR